MSKCAKRGLLLAAVASSRRSFARVALAAALAVTLLFMGGDEAQADSFNPITTWSVANTVADTPSDVAWQFEFPEGDVQYSLAIAFYPTAWQITPSSEVGIGVQRGTVDAVLHAGLLNNPCSSPIPVHWDVTNATTDKSQTVTFEDGFDDSNRDGNIDFRDMYPDFNDRILGPAQPIMREANVADLGGGAKMLGQFLVYEPGATIAGQALDPALGYPVVTLSDNFGDPQAVRMPGATTGGCTPFTGTIVEFGTAEDGTVLLKNPKEAGTYTFNAFSVGMRDADGDGHENTLDTCPLDPDPTWDPRNVDADDDPDGDGIPNTCDPTPDENTGAGDHDGDGYSNRGDNCPLDANGVADADNQTDSDSDGIGDACDPNPNDADTEGEAPEAFGSQDVAITGAEAPTATATPLLAANPTAAPAAETIAPTVIAPPAGGAGSTSGTSWPWWPLAAAVGGTAAAAAGVLLAYRRRKAKA